MDMESFLGGTDNPSDQDSTNTVIAYCTANAEWEVTDEKLIYYWCGRLWQGSGMAD